jgi:monofunctional biosynthetic peptidoglycan transglycosylase
MPRATIVRKPYEILVALLLDIVVSKEDQITIYLNYAEWGPEIWGASAAARYHFGTTADRLTLEQALILASILPSPLAHVQRASPQLLAREWRVLSRMRRAGLVRFDAGSVPIMDSAAMARAATGGECGSDHVE